jgi:hypothetical protein
MKPREAIDHDGDAWTDRPFGLWNCVTSSSSARDDAELEERYGPVAYLEPSP